MPVPIRESLDAAEPEKSEDRGDAGLLLLAALFAAAATAVALLPPLLAP